MNARAQTFNPFTIAGSGGGGKGGGGSSGGTEAANTLKSHQTAKVVDLLSEGPIRGIVGGLRGVFLNGVVLQNANGSMNFSDAIVQWVNGYPNQPIMAGFAAQSTEIQVGQLIQQSVPLIRSIQNTDADRARVTLSVPTLQSADKKGNINGTEVSFRIEVQNNGGGYRWYGDFSISGKTTSKYQRAMAFMLPTGGPWDIRVTRLTPDSNSAMLQNELYWDSYTQLIDDRINYNLSACVGIIIDSKQFNAIPNRTYFVDGILCEIPSNYNPDAATYSGVWDGNFKTDWTNNPAWVLRDLIVKSRYGIGEFIKPNQVDKWALYKVSQWCDGLVPDGRGGHERRFTCNVQIRDQAQAFDLINSMASVFRGFVYWNGGQLVAVADQPSDPVQAFTNANVVNGAFNYSGSDIRARHTMANIGWNDPSQLGAARIAVVEDQEAISRFGIQKTDIGGFGITRESQALRAGKWALYTEQHEGESNVFTTGLEAAWTRPGDIIEVADVHVTGERRGGRVAAGSTTTRVELDSPVADLEPNHTETWCTCFIGETGAVSRRVVGMGEDGQYVDVNPPFDEPPAPDTVWVVSEVGTVETTKWRCMGIKQGDKNQYEITALRHYAQKWGVVEQNLIFSEPNISDIQVIPTTPTDLKVAEYLVQTSPVSVGVRATISWVSDAPVFIVGYRETNGNWTYVRTDQKVVDISLTEAVYDFVVTPYSALGYPGPPATLTQEIKGRTIPPLPPTNFRINVVDGVALFEWTPSEEIDVRIGGWFELRHSAATANATWVGSQSIIPSIPGTASSVETSYRTGTWMLRTFDSTSLPSPTWAVVIASEPDERYSLYQRFCESPDWLGTHHNTEVKLPQEWLTLGATGGLWDAQTTNMDTWPDVDVLDDPTEGAASYSSGTYQFFNQFDAGSVFPIRFSSDILAFVYQEPDTFLDNRFDDSDDWPEWDELADNLDGTVQLEIRTTNDDPNTEEAKWSGWQPFNSATYTARGFQFRAILTAPFGQNIGVETMCVIGDFRDKIDRGEDVVYSAKPLTVPFNIKFYNVPAVVITVQDALADDKITLTNKTRETFTVEITNAGAAVNRTFDWHAMGY